MTVTWLLLAIAATMIGQLLREVLAFAAARLGPELIERAANRLPERRREIRRLEWLAEFDSLVRKPAPFFSLSYAVGVWAGAARIRNESKPVSRSVDSKALDRQIVRTAFVPVIGMVEGIAFIAKGRVLLGIGTDMPRVIGVVLFLGTTPFIIDLVRLLKLRRRRDSHAEPPRNEGR